MLREAAEKFRADVKVGVRRLDAASAYGLDGGLAAEAAARGGDETSPGVVLVDPDTRGQIHKHHVFAVGFSVACFVPNGNDVLATPDDALGEKQSCRELQVVAGSPHGDGQGNPAQPDFQRLFAGERILAANHTPLGPFRKGDGREISRLTQH